MEQLIVGYILIRNVEYMIKYVYFRLINGQEEI